MLTLPCDVDPPMVALSPENGPQNGVRNPRCLSSASSSAQVTPDSTTTYISASLTSTILFSLDVSMLIDESWVGR